LESRLGIGIGSSLTQEALTRADELGEAVVIVLGKPSYYRRLGFAPAMGRGIYPPEGADLPSDAWMAKPLNQYRVHLRGTAKYSLDFTETGSVPGL
jgi:putative acetyltransferase